MNALPTDRVRLIAGDCRDMLAQLVDASIDSVVTDPPYGLGFMGQHWDHGGTAFDVAFWADVLRVLKPGGHVAAFGGTRSYHRLAAAIEDAGFEIRDQLAWVYGSGFPKSHDVSKGIDRSRRRDYVQAAIDLGVTFPNRSVDDWTKEDHAPGDFWWSAFKASLPSATWAVIERKIVGQAVSGHSAWFVNGEGNVTAPATPEAARWQGWGTALKPAWEPIVLARKPLIGTVAANVLAHGTGALNIDGCRVEALDGYTDNAVTQGINTAQTSYEPRRERRTFEPASLGRWPANLLHDGSAEVVECFPETASGEPEGGIRQRAASTDFGIMNDDSWRPKPVAQPSYADSGSAARFFYTAKADADDRLGSRHPTVKPLDLMQWLVRLVTPVGGTVLDPFAGTGTTGEAAWREGMRAVLIERDETYCADIRRRMSMALAGPDERMVARVKAKGVNGNPGPLFEWRALRGIA